MNFEKPSKIHLWRLMLYFLLIANQVIENKFWLHSYQSEFSVRWIKYIVVVFILSYLNIKMAKLIFQLLVLACVTYLTVASVAIALPNPSNYFSIEKVVFVFIESLRWYMIDSCIEFPGQCYDGKHAYTVGVHYPPNNCLRLNCNEDFILEFESLVHSKKIGKNRN